MGGIRYKEHKPNKVHQMTQFAGALLILWLCGIGIAFCPIYPLCKS